ncbi:MAG: hypothetical protein QOH08_667 [Chloroflexota bacterium]|jgi:uncharacterized protein (DUF58 family)|nr:hypothetical protein [Chloroflexota bacterium]
MTVQRTGLFPWPIAVVLLVAAAITREPVVLVAAAAALAGWVVSSFTSRTALRGVDATVEVTPSRMVAGDVFTVRLVIANRKPLPMPWLEVRLALPEGIDPEPAAPGMPRGSVGAGFAPRAHERVTLAFTLRARQRGAYELGPVRLRSGDWLGFTSVDGIVDPHSAIVVYPTPLSVADHHRPSLRPLAETATKRGLLPDPLRFRGVREHRSGDPRKEIHWKASARLGGLQTKVYEPATSLDAVFLLNVATYDQYWIQADPDAAEVVISATAELIRLAADAGRQVGLVTNGIDNVTHERPRSALGRGPRPLTRSLEILARLGPYASHSPEAVFLRERGRLPWGATLVCVTPVLGPHLAGALLALRRAHHRVLAVTIDEPDVAIRGRLRSADVAVDSLRIGARRAAS